MRRFVRFLGVFMIWAAITGGLAYAVHANRHGIDMQMSSGAVQNKIITFVNETKNNAGDFIGKKMRETADVADEIFASAISAGRAVSSSIRDAYDHGAKAVNDAFGVVVKSAFSILDVPEKPAEAKKTARYAHYDIIDASYSVLPPPRTLSEIKRRKQDEEIAQVNAHTVPSASPAMPPEKWTPEQNDLSVEAVLVPRQVTVISSSHDGRIADVPVGHGDTFKKGDLLIAYDCSDLQAEADIVNIEKDLTRKKVEGSDKLFKLDIISDIDRMGAEVEDRQIRAKSRLYQARMKDCEIRARFDGRVTNRLANPGEYTRTDRVLLEVASNEPLQAEFLVPSKWLRWVNVGAPISIVLSETEKTYIAKIQRIHGEVDPVSQSIQIIAALDPYDDPLLPGMSGQAKIDVNAIREAGINGYLETTPVSYTSP